MENNYSKPIQILELFGGIGAPRCALRNLGIPIKSIDYVEIDEKAVRSYNKMFEKDLGYKTQDIVGWNLLPDILIHGSPCQDFSISGHQKGADEGSGTRSSLMWETLRIIENLGEWKPKYVLWENVTNVLSKHMKHNFDKYINRMKDLGYKSTYKTLDARDFGLPQARKRVFTVSYLDGDFDFENLKTKPMRDIKGFLEHTDDEKYLVKQPSMLKILNKKKSNFCGKLNIIDKYAYTITTKQMRCPNSGIIDLHNGQYRYLTERECWRLQGFTDEDFENALTVNKSREGKMNGILYKQAGNSMPIPVLEAIFEEMLRNEI